MRRETWSLADVAMPEVPTPEQLDAYPAAFRTSWLHAELHKTRNFKPYMKKGLVLGSLLFGIAQVLFKG